MNVNILFVISSDPRTTRRTAEAIRIAAGIEAGRRSMVSIYLRGPAVLALSEFPDELVDDDNYTRYLPILAETGRPVYVERGSPHLEEIGEPAVKFQEVTDHELALLAAGNNYVTRF